MASLYKRPNGTYCVRVADGRKDGKPHIVSATYKPPAGLTAAQEKKGAKQFADLFEAAVRNGVYVPGVHARVSRSGANGLTIGAFIQEYYYQRIELRLSPNTVGFYR